MSKRSGNSGPRRRTPRETVDTSETSQLWAAAKRAANLEAEARAQRGVSATVLEARGVRRSLPIGRERVDILKSVTFGVDRGEIVALLGPSGNGKSTLLGILAGLDNPTAGQVFIDGEEITAMRESALARVRNRKVGMIFQAFNLIPTLTASENVEVPLYVGKHPGRPSLRAKEILELVGLGHRLHHRPNQLSGGEQQRVAVARALVTRPAIVIADEPTGNLDSRNGAGLLNMIQEFRRTLEMTFLIATHDLHVASIADRQVRIVEGILQDPRPGRS